MSHDDQKPSACTSSQFRNKIEGFSVTCRNHNTPLWWPLARLIPPRWRPAPPLSEALGWFPCAEDDAGEAAAKAIRVQAEHAARFPSHRVVIRESGVLTYSGTGARPWPFTPPPADAP